MSGVIWSAAVVAPGANTSARIKAAIAGTGHMTNGVRCGAAENIGVRPRNAPVANRPRAPFACRVTNPRRRSVDVMRVRR